MTTVLQTQAPRVADAAQFWYSVAQIQIQIQTQTQIQYRINTNTYTNTVWHIQYARRVGVHVVAFQNLHTMTKTYIAHALGIEGRVNVATCCNIYYVIRVCTIVILINISSAQHLQKLYRNIKSENQLSGYCCFLIKLYLAAPKQVHWTPVFSSGSKNWRKSVHLEVPMLKSASQVPNVLWKHIILQVPKNIQIYNIYIIYIIYIIYMSNRNY